jgi:hypothetical protein
MIREERTSFLTALTFAIYSIIQGIEKGVFLFPFPLNEVAVLLVFVYIMFLQKRTINHQHLIFGFALVFKLLSQQFFWSLFLTNESLEVLYSGIWTDVFYLLYSVTWIFFIISYLKKMNSSLFYLILAVVTIPFIFGVIVNDSKFEILSFILLFTVSWRFKIDRVFKSLIALIFFLEIGKQCMLLY